MLVFALGFLLALEGATRVEQWLRHGASPFDAYTYHDELLTWDEHGLRGRPGGVYEKWRMNGHGFRGPEVRDPKPGGVLRIGVLGSSETFGLYESPGSEWPRQLERALVERGQPAEVLNAAIAGMGLVERLKTFEHRLLPLDPDVAILTVEYPSFAGATPEQVAERIAQRSAIPAERSAWWRALEPRATQRFNDALVRALPDRLREASDRFRFARQAAAHRRELGDAYLAHRRVTDAEQRALLSVVARFLELADQHRVRAIVAVPALDLDDPALFHSSWPRVDAAWVQSARSAIDPRLRALARRHDAGFVDVEAFVGPHVDEWMVDFVHFNDTGARAVGERFAEAVLKLLDASDDASTTAEARAEDRPREAAE